MINKKDKSDPIDNLEYEKVLEEEIINSYESKFLKDTQLDRKKTKFYRLKRTPLEILNRSFFFFFIGSFLFSLFLAYLESKLWFILYVISALSCVFYTPNRKALINSSLAKYRGSHQREEYVEKREVNRL